MGGRCFCAPVTGVSARRHAPQHGAANSPTSQVRAFGMHVEKSALHEQRSPCPSTRSRPPRNVSFAGSPVSPATHTRHSPLAAASGTERPPAKALAKLVRPTNRRPKHGQNRLRSIPSPLRNRRRPRTKQRHLARALSDSSEQSGSLPTVSSSQSSKLTDRYVRVDAFDVHLRRRAISKDQSPRSNRAETCPHD